MLFFYRCAVERPLDWALTNYLSMTWATLPKQLCLIYKTGDPVLPPSQSFHGHHVRTRHVNLSVPSFFMDQLRTREPTSQAVRIKRANMCKACSSKYMALRSCRQMSALVAMVTVTCANTFANHKCDTSVNCD